MSSSSTESHLVRVAGSKEELTSTVAAYVLEHAAKAVAARGVFSIAFSGGSLPAAVCPGLLSQTTVPWSKWVVLFSDERVVPLDHADSNYKAVHDALLKHTAIPKDQIITLDPSLSADAAAAKYEADMLAKVKDGVVDLVLLGMGPDGHTCSLFPHHALLREQSKLVASIADSPKPPPQRITLTPKAVNSARAVAFVCTGEGKADVLQKVLEESENGEGALPARLIQPHSGPAVWFVDGPAAAKLSKETLAAKSKAKTAGCDTL